MQRFFRLQAEYIQAMNARGIPIPDDFVQTEIQRVGLIVVQLMGGDNIYMREGQERYIEQDLDLVHFADEYELAADEYQEAIDTGRPIVRETVNEIDFPHYY